MSSDEELPLLTRQYANVQQRSRSPGLDKQKFYKVMEREDWKILSWRPESGCYRVKLANSAAIRKLVKPDQLRREEEVRPHVSLSDLMEKRRRRLLEVAEEKIAAMEKDAEIQLKKMESLKRDNWRIKDTAEELKAQIHNIEDTRETNRVEAWRLETNG